MNKTPLLARLPKPLAMCLLLPGAVLGALLDLGPRGERELERDQLDWLENNASPADGARGHWGRAPARQGRKET